MTTTKKPSAGKSTVSAKTKPTYYITTPIYYPSGDWHLGHCYTTVCCDALARYKRLMGYDVYYLTGTDEHGKKIEDTAKANSITPKEFVDNKVASVKELWKLLDISYDGFIRTTDKRHKDAVQNIFDRLYKQGDIYKGNYTGKYCTPCESFWTDSQLKDGNCPDCGRAVADAQEEAYFFRLSKYRDKLIELLTTTEFLAPKSRVNEMVGNFLSEGLTDLCVSRTTFDWGVSVKHDPKHTVYVWIDALSNYITALGYDGSKKSKDTLFEKYWPCDIHMVGKEIVRFHSIIWPALLMELDLPIPKKVFGHGWLLFGGDKMSKSKGNVVDPFVLSARYGIDTLRYFLLREVPFGSDGIYTNELLLTRYNSDLCNDLGNLVKRTVAMSEQYFDGVVVPAEGVTEADGELIAMIDGLSAVLDNALNELKINKALESIFAIVGRANKYIDETCPWILSKDALLKGRLSRVLYTLLEAVRCAATALKPFLVSTPGLIFDSLGRGTDLEFCRAIGYGKVRQYKVKGMPPLFVRLDVKKELLELDKIAQQEIKPASTNKAETRAEQSIISIDDFGKVKLLVGTVVGCDKIEKADKLLRLTVDMGDHTRTIVSGIASYYAPKDMIGKTVTVVSNLAPAKLRGIVSEGMILCADSPEGVVLVAPEKSVPPGSAVR